MTDNIRKEVYHIKDRPDGKSLWIKIGTAFVNKDGSINALLDTLPVDGRLHIRDEMTCTMTKEEKEEMKAKLNQENDSDVLIEPACRP